MTTATTNCYSGVHVGSLSLSSNKATGHNTGGVQTSHNAPAPTYINGT